MHSFFIVSTFSGAGLSTICMGLVHALDRIGVRVTYFKPVTQGIKAQPDPSLLNPYLAPSKTSPIPLAKAQKWFSEGKPEQLLESVLEMWQTLQESSDVVVVEGLVPQTDEEYIDNINQEVARVLGSDIILVTAKQGYSFDELDDRIAMTAGLFGGLNNPKLIGCIVNKVGAPTNPTSKIPEQNDISGADKEKLIAQYMSELAVLNRKNFRCLGFVHWHPEFMAPRFFDVATHLGAKIINAGNSKERRVSSIAFLARTVTNIIDAFKPGSLMVTPGDRDDVLVAIALAELNGVPLAGVLLTGNLPPSEKILKFCGTAFSQGLPVALVEWDTLATAQQVNALSPEIPTDDKDRLNAVMQGIAPYIDAKWLAEQSKLPQEMRLSPTAFKHQLVVQAQRQQARIVLPEGEEPRTIQAAVQCAARRIAKCILLGNPEVVKRSAETLGIELPEAVEIIDPDNVRSRYIEPMVELRTHKGLTSDMAAAQLEDNVVLGTMMLAQNEVDGLVSGAEHTTANTIRPALQLIKTTEKCTLVSSVFFMLLPEQALVYGDCAVNPNPTAEELADIAIQSGLTAEAFGIEPRIAMISYSTGTSGGGESVEKVRKATEIAQRRMPEFLIDGPLQYDAAAIASVARSKAPHSPVAGRANVFIFPDLNTGNTTYKAVQRSAHVVSIGPVLQGLRKPVNDLSRGASVEDIVYTIAITAVQSGIEMSCRLEQ